MKPDYLGPLQPTKSRNADTVVWAATLARPGPSAYTLPSSFGAQALSARDSNRSCAFSKLRSTRPPVRVTTTASATSYTPQHWSLAQHPSAAAALVGTSTRDGALKLYTVATFKPH